MRTILLALVSGLIACRGSEPPPAGLARAALSQPGARWEHTSRPGLRIYWKPHSYAAGLSDSMAARAREARRHDLALLGARDFSPPIDLFYFDDRGALEALAGTRATGFSDRANRAVLLVANPGWRPFERHEIMHVLAYNLWGPPADPPDWISEGLAVFADGRCAGFPIDALVAQWRSAGALFPADTLVTRFRSLGDLRAYLQAGSFIGWIYNTRGRDAVRQLWQRGVGGAPGALSSVALDSLDAAWRRSLAAEQGLPKIPAGDLKRIQERGCGISVSKSELKSIPG